MKASKYNLIFPFGDEPKEIMYNSRTNALALIEDVIENLTVEFLELCAEHNIQYSATLVTNGYLLPPEVAGRLESLKISSVQVTLDGPPVEHDKRRILVDSEAEGL